MPSIVKMSLFETIYKYSDSIKYKNFQSAIHIYKLEI